MAEGNRTALTLPLEEALIMCDFAPESAKLAAGKATAEALANQIYVYIIYKFCKKKIYPISKYILSASASPETRRSAKKKYNWVARFFF